MSEDPIATGDNRNANPAHIGAVTLICCDVEYEPKDYGKLGARMVGPDVCLSCEKCGRDVAVVSP